MKYAVSLNDDDGDREGRATPAGEATLEMLSRRVWALAQMDPATVADILSGDERIPLPDVSPSNLAPEKLLRPWDTVVRASPAPLTDRQYRKFLQGEDISSEAIVESEMARTYAANKNLEISSGIISVLVLLGLLVAFFIVKSPASKEASLIGGSLVLSFTIVWRLLQGAMRYAVLRRSLETVITELAGVKTRAKEDEAIQRAQAEQLKSLEVELTRVRAEAAEAREEAARLRARRTS
jgi:hypothetical protein